MKHLKLFESFYDIYNICKQYGIKNYTLNKDESINVNGNVNINNKHINKLLLHFNKINGNFDCSYNNLTSLEGCPKIVEGSFSCGGNKLASLEDGPKIVSKHFVCHGNKLTSLEGCPEKINENFYCNNNQLITLKGGPKVVNGIFNCTYNQLTSVEGAPQITDYFICFGNKLTTFDYFPKCTNINCEDNPIYNIWNLFRDTSKIELFNDMDIIQDDVVILDRLNYFLEEIGKPTVKSVDGYKYI